MNYKLMYESKPSREDTKILSEGIAAQAKLKKNHIPIEEFAFFIRDEIPNIIGGLNGAMYYGCLYIDQLWVSEALRGQGYGTQLMQAAEKLGKEKGCLFSTVNTMDWEALDFYKKLGYWIEFERQGYAKESTFYFLRKAL